MWRRWSLPASVIGILALVGILIVWFIIPTVRTIVAIRNATVAEYEALERRYRQGRILTRVLRDYALVRNDLETFRAAVPAERDVLLLVRTFEQIATAHELQESVAIERNAARAIGAGIARVPFTLEYTGSYPHLVAALHDLERLPVPPLIESFAFTTVSASGGAGAPSARVQLVLRGFLAWRAEEDAVPLNVRSVRPARAPTPPLTHAEG